MPSRLASWATGAQHLALALDFTPLNGHEAPRVILGTGLFSDFTIFSRVRSYDVHRCIICPRSDFFQAACEGEFKEAKTGEVHLNDEDPSVVEKMVDYFYKLDYVVDGCSFCQPSTEVSVDEAEEQSVDQYTFGPDLEEEVPMAKGEEQSTSVDRYTSGSDHREGQKDASGDPPSLFHARMYTIGEKYGISGLKSLAKEKFEAAARHIWCGSTFYSVVRFIYGSTDGGLRDVISSLAHRNVASLKTQPDFAETLEEFPSFTLDLLWEMMGKSLQAEEEKAILSPARGSHVPVC
ncbi:BTB/POZ domain-containing protein [Histoplasma capsulatum G186AR]|uniref:BTB/POZ domain-containing protein n=1 Tax=Ajellomyces capsulatus (strain G186AR / H82 / ATCC MYA-2454 / RMSCC 2432) TaxID=447093 RepID=C0NW36_AJECG|nr:BTB/POZ domain-containing protein [Histoplasma capsulatum G186AR]EEH04141.1 BTB/POZ domain-containing protein [Histoplasma capsulatum G186AR]